MVVAGVVGVVLSSVVVLGVRAVRKVVKVLAVVKLG